MTPRYFSGTNFIAQRNLISPSLANCYSLRFKTKVTFGHKLRYKIKVTFGEISLKLCQTNWNVARNNESVVDKVPSQITVLIFGLDVVDAHQCGLTCEINHCSPSMVMNGHYYGHH